MLLLKMFGKCSIQKEKGNSKLEKKILTDLQTSKISFPRSGGDLLPLPPKVRT